MKTPVEWLVSEVAKNGLSMKHKDYLEIIEKSLEMEKQQKKDLVIGTYIDLKMKNNNLAFGMEYISKVGKLEEEAEKYYTETFKQQEQ